MVCNCIITVIYNSIVLVIRIEIVIEMIGSQWQDIQCFLDQIQSWSLKKQHVDSRSSIESEYRALALLTSEILWINALLIELHIHLAVSPVMQCDNQSAIVLAKNPVYHANTKHIEVDIHIIHEKVQAQQIQSTDQTADVLTKALTYRQFNYLWTKLNILPGFSA